MRWQAQRARVEAVYDDAHFEQALQGFGALARTAQKPVDRDLMQMRQARTLTELGRGVEGVRIYERLSRQAVRRVDRARARYELARIAEDGGFAVQAVTLYRQLVRAYPDIMPGWRALQHLERIAVDGDRSRVDAHLAWTHQLFPELARTTLADNLLYFAARQAYERFLAERQPAWAEAAERLYRQIADGYRLAGLWDNALWDLSWLYHHLGRFREEVLAIERVQSTRERSSFMGNYEHPYFWVGQLRIARLQMTVLDDPAAAVSAYRWFLAEYTISRWQDDALFWQACAYLRMGDRGSAESAFARIPEVYEDSKYLAEVEAARQNPRGEVCVPDVFEEGEW